MVVGTRARLPDDPATAEPADWFSTDELAVLPLSSKSHWDVPIDVDGRIVHVLAAHPTPPVFDGPEDRNGLRNAEEIAFWADYVAGSDSTWIVDDVGVTVVSPPMPSSSSSVISTATRSTAIRCRERPTRCSPSTASRIRCRPATGRCWLRSPNGGPTTRMPAIRRSTLPTSPTTRPGNLRVDYVLPSDSFEIVDAGVFWPPSNDELAGLVIVEPLASSDHRLVWVDLR